MLTHYNDVKSQLESCVLAAGRNVDDVTLVAVSKTVGLPEVEDAISQGAHDFGENRPELLTEKQTNFPEQNWHFIGNIQSRQIKNIVPHACLIHSLCELKHAQKIDSVAAELGKVQRVLVQVNVSGEKSKSGFTAEELPDFLESCLKLNNISVDGLMTMAPIKDEAHANLPSPDEVFERAQKLLEKCQSFMPASFNQLSAGMTDDWAEAIHHGSTIVRIGRAIFA